MANRLGLLPWDRDRLSPAELKELWEGWHWRRSRDMEVLGKALVYLMSMMSPDVDYDKIVSSLPGYDQGIAKTYRDMSGTDTDAPWLI